MKHTLAGLALLAASAVAVHPAAAQSFSYPDFSSTSGLQLNGNAHRNGSKLSLTYPTYSQSGTAWSLNQVHLGSNASFSTVFTFDIQQRGGLANGADGLTFTLQNNTNSEGGAGGGIGYYGIPNSATVEFDTYQNEWDPSSNHVGINTNGVLGSIVAANELTDFDNGQTWWAWIDYDGATQNLAVRWAMSAIRPAAAMLETTLDLPSILGSNDVYVGFTAGTGSGYGEHNITSWNFVNRYEEGGAPDPVTTPEPGSLILLMSGLGAMGLARRKFSKR